MDKFEYLDSLAEKQLILPQDFESLSALSKDNDPEIRAYVAQILIYAEKDLRISKLLIELCMDKDVLVRANACDTMGGFPSTEIERCLLRVVENKKESSLVRRYALMSYADVSVELGSEKKSISVFKEQLQTTRSVSVRAACLYGLCSLGDRSCFKDIFILLNARNYHDRSFVIHILLALAESAQDLERHEIFECFNERLHKENVQSVRILLVDGMKQLY